MATAATTFELIPAGQALAPNPAGPVRVLPIPWRDPHTVEPEELQQYIAMLERACLEHPQNADFRTCLGMAHAMNYDVYKSMDALEEAVRIDSGNFFAQLKYAELFYRIRGLPQAERETLKALDLASNSWEMALARKQLQVVRELRRNGTQKPEWTGSLIRPALALLALFVVLSALMVWKS